MKVILVFLFSGLGLVYAECIELGWTGGTVGDTTMWVKGDLVEKNGKVNMTYKWKGGVMTGSSTGKNYSGKWKQTNSRGDFFLGPFLDGKSFCVLASRYY